MKFQNSYFEGEVREGFFVASMMKRAWAAQLEVLEDVDKVCRKHQISWFADYGTLLGAVRHRGFIPWDDDLDICMKREDYNKFLAAAPKEMPEGYYLHNIYTDENYSEMFTRVLNSRVISFEKNFLEKFHGCPYGMGIDIFPMDYIAPSLEEESAQFELIQTVISIVQEIDSGMTNQEAVNQWAYWVEETFQIKIDPERSFRNQLLLLVEQIFSMYKEKETEEITVMQLWMKNRECRMPKSYYQKTLMLPFENTRVPVPAVYDAVLDKKYGNYMAQVRNGGAHDYPFYAKQEAALKMKMGANPYAYVFSKKDLNDGGVRGKVTLKKQIREHLRLMQNLHDELRKNEIEDTDEILGLLAECQENAIALGTLIEEAKGEGTASVKELEKYCELIYQIYQEIAKGVTASFNMHQRLPGDLAEQIKYRIKTEIDIRREMIFLPYKATTWDALESVWEAADQDLDCNAYVIPIPYFYKNPDGSIGEMQDETNLFPKNVPITRYDAFDFENRCPDVIYFQNPYDEYDSAITVHPFFYSANLKKYTENLIYIPYFLADEIAPDDQRAIENIKYCCVTPGVIHADRVIVQSEGMRNIYIDLLSKTAGEETREIWEQKILGLGSPKMDKNAVFQKENMDLPEEWLEIIKKPDGGQKKIVLYGTNISVLLHYEKEMLEKMKSVFAVFKERKDTIALIWKLDISEEENVELEQFEILEEFHEMIHQYQMDGWGIFDVSGNAERAVLLCDAYYGDRGYLAQLCLEKKKPLMIQNVENKVS